MTRKPPKPNAGNEPHGDRTEWTAGAEGQAKQDDIDRQIGRSIAFDGGKPVPPDPATYTTGDAKLDREIDHLFQRSYPQWPDKLESILKKFFVRQRTLEGVKAAVDHSDLVVKAHLNTWIGRPMTTASGRTYGEWREHYHDVALQLARQAEARIADQAARTEGAAGSLLIDLSQWRKSQSRNFIQDLLEDECRDGVTVRPRRHGKPHSAARELRRSLRKEHTLPEIADAIKSVKGKKHTYLLDIPRDRLKWLPPKT